MDKFPQTNVQPDDWQALTAFTAARIALGSAGVSLPTKAVLELRLAYARAKDAVYSALEAGMLKEALLQNGLAVYDIQSRAATRDEYLRRPDLGRVLQAASADLLKDMAVRPADISLIIADGLSANAVKVNALPFVQAFLGLAAASHYTIAPLVLVTMARVAIGDVIGSLLRARLTIVLIGEQPGLSAADSMGAYITYQPLPGTTDERRNCVSNIRAGGLAPTLAAAKVMQIVETAFRLGLTGIMLKDNGPAKLL